MLASLNEFKIWVDSNSSHWQFESFAWIQISHDVNDDDDDDDDDDLHDDDDLDDDDDDNLDFSELHMQ